jgi:hypothetical protein
LDLIGLDGGRVAFVVVEDSTFAPFQFRFVVYVVVVAVVDGYRHRSPRHYSGCCWDEIPTRTRRTSRRRRWLNDVGGVVGRQDGVVAAVVVEADMPRTAVVVFEP